MLAAPFAHQKKAERQSTINETFKATKKGPGSPKKKQAGDPTKASPAKRQKKAAVQAVHPQLATPTYDHYDPDAAAAHHFYGQVEAHAQHVRSLGLPVNYEEIQRILCDPSQSFELYLQHLQQPFPSPASVHSSPISAHQRALLAGQYAAAQHASRMQHAQQTPGSASPVRPASSSTPLPPTPMSISSKPLYMEQPRPTKLSFSINGQGRAELCPRSSPTPPPIAPSTPRSIFAEPKAQVIAAEVEGMGRVVTEWSVLVDRLGPARASVAEARARGTVMPVQMAHAPSHSFDGTTPSFAFADAGRPRRAFGESEDAQVVAERNQRIAKWLQAEDEDEEHDVETPAPPPMEDNEALEDLVLVSGKSIRSLQRVKRRREDDDVDQPFDISPSTPLAKLRTRARTMTSQTQAVGDDGEIACRCGQGEVEGEDMVQCESCRNWHHLACVELRAEELPESWECGRCEVQNGTPVRYGGAEPILTHSAATPRVGHFSRAHAPELVLAPSPMTVTSRHVRLASGYGPFESPSVSRNSSYNYGQRRRVQSGAFEDLPSYHDEEMDTDNLVIPSWHEGPVQMPIAMPTKPIYPSTPSRYVYKTNDGYAHPNDPTPPSTIDGGSHSRSSSSAGRRFSFPGTPTTGQDAIFAAFDTASSTRFVDLMPSFSPVCDSSTAHWYRQRYASVSKDLMTLPNPITVQSGGGSGHRRKASMRGYGASAALAKVTAAGEGMERSSSGLGIGFDATTDVGDYITMDA